MSWRPALVSAMIMLTAATACGGGGMGPSAQSGGHTGKVQLNFAGIADLAVQRDGKVVAVTEGFQIVRLTTDGSLDDTFGAGGSVQAHFRGRCTPPPGWESACRSSRPSASATAVAIQPDGKILATGQWRRTVAVDENHSEQIGAGLALARFDPDGSLDPGFGTGGMVAGGTGTAWGGDVAIQVDGKIVVTDGDTLSRYQPDGRIDRTFGEDGRVETDLDWTEFGAAVLAVQDDGKLVVASSAGRSGQSDFAVARFLRDGERDRSFGDNGRVLTDFGGKFEGVEALAIQRDGKLVAAGDSSPPAGESEFAVSRYLPDGRLDESFGNGGKMLTSFGDGLAEVYAVALSAEDGEIVVAGDRTRDDDTVYEFAVARYLRDGRMDPDFGRQGKVATSLSGWDTAYAVVVHGDGKITVGGTWQWSQPCGEDCESFGDAFAVARYLSDGSLDLSFGEPRPTAE